MKRVLLAVAVLLTGSSVVASDAYFVRFLANTASVNWVDDILFFNTNATAVDVRFLGVSNGAAAPVTPPLTLPPLQSVSLASSPAGAQWTPVTFPSMFILHLDIPAGVVVESRDEFYSVPAIPELFPMARGKVSLPVFRDLRPAGEHQVHLGTDLSDSSSHINVGIYNAGVSDATATIEVRRTCDEVVVDTRTVTIPANTVVQVGGLSDGLSSACTQQHTPAWMRAVLVTVDQPSLTFVSNVTNHPGVDGVPVVGLGVSGTQRF